MKRFFFSAIALAAVVVGCTKSNVLETAPSFETPIEFESYTGKAPMTKATITDLASVQTDGFHATGFIHNATEPYLDKDVAYNSTNKTWSYDGIAYWPAEGTMDFVAYGKNAVKAATVNDVSGTNLISFTSGSTTDFKFSVPDKVAEQEDLVVAVPKLNQSKIDKVIFDFKHVLSKVGFSVKANNDYDATTGANNVNIIIKNITLNGTFSYTGTVDLKAESPSISPVTSTTVTSYSLFDHNYNKTVTTGEYAGFVCKTSTTAQPIYINTTYAAGNLTTDPTANSSATPDNRYLMIMPGQVRDLADGATPYIEVVYELTEGKEELAKVWLTEDGTENGANWTFVGGKSYEFVLSVSTSAIGFSVTVQDWTNYFPVKDENGTVTDDGVVNLTPIN